MAVSKRKKSKSRRNMRRSQNSRLSIPSLSKCSRCGEPKLPHRVCIHCGYYRDREIIKMDEL